MHVFGKTFLSILKMLGFLMTTLWNRFNCLAVVTCINLLQCLNKCCFVMEVSLICLSLTQLILYAFLQCAGKCSLFNYAY